MNWQVSQLRLVDSEGRLFGIRSGLTGGVLMRPGTGASLTRVCAGCVYDVIAGRIKEVKHRRRMVLRQRDLDFAMGHKATDRLIARLMRLGSVFVEVRSESLITMGQPDMGGIRRISHLGAEVALQVEGRHLDLAPMVVRRAQPCLVTIVPGPDLRLEDDETRFKVLDVLEAGKSCGAFMAWHGRLAGKHEALMERFGINLRSLDELTEAVPVAAEGGPCAHAAARARRAARQAKRME